MKRLMLLAITIGPLACGAAWLPAAEFRLRPQCQCPGPVTVLGDVAEIITADRTEAERLAAIELFPAPPEGRQRYLRVREIQDLLLLRGINLARHRFSGSSRVVISRAGQRRPVRQKPLSISVLNRAHRLLSEAVVQYLKQHVADTEPWTVEVQLDQRQARLVSHPGNKISISGGAQPWTGKQRFEVAVDTPEGTTRFPVSAQVSLPPAVVVAARTLPRGAILSAADLQLDRKRPIDTRADVFGSIDEAVGRQTTRVITADKVLQQQWLRAPLLVRRGEIVTVWARGPGVTVRTQARARKEGSSGELIAVESLEDRTTYFARVCGIRELEVYARAVKSRSNEPTRPAATVRGSQVRIVERNQQ